MKHLDITDIFSEPEKFFDRDVMVCGWVRTSRDSKNVAFLEINDGTALKHLQVVINKAHIADPAPFLSLGTAVRVEGRCVKPHNEKQSVELNAARITLLGESPLDYPIQKKATTLDFLRTIPHLRVRTNTFNAMLRLRSRLSFAIHKFFMERNYTYVHTPIITGSDCEGAGEVFKVTTLGFCPDHKTEEAYYAADFFGRQAGLTVSGQLEGEVAAMAMGKIYTFGPTFRAENSNTTRHAAEFWQIEPEVAFAEIDDIIEIATDMIKSIIRDVMEHCDPEISFFDLRYEKGLKEKLSNVVESEFGRLDYGEAIKLLEQSERKFQYPIEWGCDLQTEHERYLTDEVFKKPVFVVNYPKKLKSFYMKQNSDGLTVAATDLLVPGVGEIIGCSQREDNQEKLLQAINDRGMNVADYEHYLALRKFGSVPHSGFGLGLERMLMYITGIGNIRDTALYPRATGELS